MKPIKARGLAEVRILPTKDEDSAVLVLVDTTKKATGYLINPDGLQALLVPALEFAVKWAKKPDLQLETLVGPRQALPATRLVLERGRDATECAVRVFVGEVELTFLIPLEEVIRAVGELKKQVDPETVH